MFPAFEILAQVRATNSSLAKDAILKGMSSEELVKEVQRALFYGRNSYLTYNIKKIDPFTPTTNQATTLDQFYGLLEKLNDTSLSGNAAMKEVVSALNGSTKENADWFVSILTKNIDVGMGASSINKVWKDLVPTFDVQLAYPIADYWHTVTFPTYVEEKHNGLRGAAITKPDAFRFTSRQGKDFPAGEAYRATIELLAGGEKFMFDGEVKGVKLNPKCKKAVEAHAAGKSWEFTQANSMLGNMSTTLEDMREYCALFIWDVVDYDYFMSQGKQGKDDPLKIRKMKLKQLFDKAGDLGGFVRMCSTHLAHSKEDVYKFRDYIISMGGEGAMVKDPNRSYDCTRSTACLKHKKFYPCDMRIVGAIEGKGHSKGTLGALMMEAEHHTAGLIKCKVGTGWTAPEADMLWAMYLGGTLLGKIAELEYQEITVGNSLLFPSYEHLREDKTETSFY